MRRGRWQTAMGILFMVSGGIVMVRQLLIWGPEFVWDFTVAPEITSEKISFGMMGLGALMTSWGILHAPE
ncbi:conserved hypothetical protein [Nitrosopumilaceae archaeon]|nr:hypothetical protein [Nitrosopumilus sp.]CAI9832419.1 conserved hypothetical protein [Nitrosopumilaceae archaeon]MDA7942049.1 hypothetical protein [Nitrosopumilus sp.]MDA7943079.1 hypothetical protein [Nitrosopumilus sp.]MDA7945171.1 hypothetical protein [Nitrosopumilus sp.]